MLPVFNRVISSVYFVHSTSLDPPETAWSSASKAADPAPYLLPLWATQDHELSFFERVHLKLNFGADDIIATMSAVCV